MLQNFGLVIVLCDDFQPPIQRHTHCVAQEFIRTPKLDALPALFLGGFDDVQGCSFGGHAVRLHLVAVVQQLAKFPAFPFDDDYFWGASSGGSGSRQAFFLPTVQVQFVPSGRTMNVPFAPLTNSPLLSSFCRCCNSSIKVSGLM